MSTPVTLPVVRLDGRVLVDGGIVDNIPVDVARAMGADVVIAVDATSTPLKPEQLKDLLGVGLQLVEVLMRARNAAFAQAPDLLIRPELEGRGFQDYSDPDAVIAIGRRAAEQALGRLREVAAGAPATRAPETAPAVVVVEVDVRGNRKVTAGSVRSAFGVPHAEPLGVDRLLRGFDRVWATGLFETAWMDVEAAEGGVKVVLDVAEKPRLAVELGVAYDEADQASIFARLRNQNLFGHGERLDVTLLGGEREAGARVSLLGDGLWRRSFGYVAGGEIVEERPVFYVGGDSVGRAEFLRKLAWGGAQASFGFAVVARAWLTAGRVTSSRGRASPSPAARTSIAWWAASWPLTGSTTATSPRGRGALRPLRVEPDRAGGHARLLAPEDGRPRGLVSRGGRRDRRRRRPRAQREGRPRLRALPARRARVPARASARGEVGPAAPRRRFEPRRRRARVPRRAARRRRQRLGQPGPDLARRPRLGDRGGRATADALRSHRAGGRSRRRRPRGGLYSIAGTLRPGVRSVAILLTSSA